MIGRVRRVLLGCALALAMPVAACGSHEPAADVVPGAPAGDVTELAGDVHATRGGATRALAKGDVVSGDDVITTGADGRVTIVLRHNQVAWSLGPNLQKRVADSAAWAAAKGAASVAVTDDRSSAAGRHAERMAADTSATSAVASGSAAGSGSASPDDQRAWEQNEADREAAKQKLEELQKERADMEERAAAAKAAADKAERARGLHVSQECLDNPLAKGCDGGEPSGGGGGGTRREACQCVAGDPLCSCLGDDATPPKGNIGSRDVQVQGGIDQAGFQRVVRAHVGDFRRCYEKLLQTQPAAAGKVRLHLTIGGDGKVTKVEVDGDAALAPTYDCMKAAARALRFPAPHDEITITYPLVFATP
jgi:hypothetical protein